ncbi:MAG: PSD1 and planctomycete cytochrome C domain-containing protein [Rubripirellula sp.]|nr:PSD1 and planctomycete cytochrome C domain-containing protein [Rubripirellula sp.]
MLHSPLVMCRENQATDSGTGTRKLPRNSRDGLYSNFQPASVVTHALLLVPLVNRTTLILFCIVATVHGCWAVSIHSQQPAAPESRSATINYLTQIKPLLAEKCYSCHGALKQESELRLETVALMLTGGDSGPAVQPGNPAESLLLQRISMTDDDQMPPHGEGSPLKPDQIKILQQWINEGCNAPEEPVPVKPADHWAFQPLVVSKQQSDTAGNPIDILLSKKRVEAGIQTAPAASRRTLIRRLYLDLIGLPPTQHQLDDQRPTTEIIDELLHSPQHGERWARHWMDIWRYSDWYGLGKQLRNSQKHLWHWRDWIINSLNKDKGYDQMIVEMLAGDEVDPENLESITGTGFLARNYYLFNRTTWLDSTIEHTSKAFLGLTINCAKCHDHKYDPITQQDYYRIRAIFEPHQVRLDPLPGETDFEKGGLPRVFDDNINRVTHLHQRGDPQSPDKTMPIAPGVPAILADFEHEIQPIKLPRSAYSPGTRPYVLKAHLEKVQAEIGTSKKARTAAEARRNKLASEAEIKSVQKLQTFEFNDDFTTLDSTKWQLIGDGWKHRKGTLSQTKSTREPQSARLLIDPPSDFDLRCNYTTTGGSTYKSVTIRFDQSDDPGYANYVYTSAHAPSPKVQAAYERDKKSVYPTEGRKALALSVGQRHELRFAIRGTLVNIWVDGEFMLAYRYPNRRNGFISLSGFDATVDFDSIQIKNLDKGTTLTQADTKAITTLNEAEQAVKIADSHYEATLARQKMLKAMLHSTEADQLQKRSPTELQILAETAGQRQAEWKLALLKHDAAVNASIPSELASINKKIEQAQKHLAQLKESPIHFTPIKGSLKALESPADKEENYPATYSPISTGRRLAFAKWITADQNPLTARVAVNHVWMRHFGQPLVDSTFDFGLRSPEPIHKDLLDLLAAEFMHSGWSFRHLHRLIVSSQTYALSASTATVSPDNLTKDPNNQFLWKMNSRRMESQVIRDSVLFLAGALDSTMGGASINPSSEARRRSIYFKHSRDQKSSFLETFDNADILQCYRRSESIVPQQALALSNSRLSIEMSNEIANRLHQQIKPHTTSEFIEATFALILARPPSDLETNACQKYFVQMGKLKQVSNSAQIRARFVQAILNHNDFITIR